MTAGSGAARAALVAWVAVALATTSACEARRGDRKAKVPAGQAGCREPEPKDAGLAEGLDYYARAQYEQAIARLRPWASAPDASSDPAAIRGLYALSFALRMTGDASGAAAQAERVRPLLEARVAEAPNLEAYYYLQALHQVREETEPQLRLVSQALAAVESGAICKEPQADDLFRVARLNQIAGRREAHVEHLRRASEAYAAAEGSKAPATYRAIVEKELGEADLAAGDAASAARRLLLAQELDPTLPGMSRPLGLALLRSDRVAEAAEHWRRTWRTDRQAGNSLLYALPVLVDVARYRERFGAAERIEGLSEYTTQALEQNAQIEGRRYLELLGKQASAGPLTPEEELERDRAEYRMSQLLTEYVARGLDLQEMALQRELVAAIHDRGLPSRN